MKKMLIIAVLLVGPLGLAAQTLVVSDTSRVSWPASPDHNTTFGSPAQPVLTSYRGELWTKANVTNGVPTGAAAFTFDWGKPTPDPNGTILSPPVKPLIQPNVEYIVFVSAVGPGGVSAKSAASVPFGFPAPPKAVASPASITP